MSARCVAAQNSGEGLGGLEWGAGCQAEGVKTMTRAGTGGSAMGVWGDGYGVFPVSGDRGAERQRPYRREGGGCAIYATLRKR